MRVIKSLACAVVCAALTSPCFVEAGERGSPPAYSRHGDVIPRSVRIAGVDGEPIPRDFGLIVLDGRVIIVVEGRTRKIVQVLDEESYVRGPPSFIGNRP